MALSDVRLRALKPRAKAYKVPDADGLYIEVRTSGAKLWRFRYCHLGKESRISLGSYPDIGLASARRKRDEARQQLDEGLDPATERRPEKLTAAFRAANSFGDVAKEYIEKMVADGRTETTTVKANWLLA